jgi:uncharacterized protein DUF3515
VTRPGNQPGSQAISRPALALAIGLPVLLAAVVVVIALVSRGQADQAGQAGQADQTGQAGQAGRAAGPLALPAVPAPAADSDGCRALMQRLPDALVSAGTNLDRRELAPPAPAGSAAWGSDQNSVTLRCGLDRPAELTRTATLLDVSGVRWLRLAGDGINTWVAVDRPVYVALTFGDAAGTGPLQDVSAAITAALPAQRVQPGGQ